MHKADRRTFGTDLREAAPLVAASAAVAAFAFLSGGYIFARSAPVALLYLLLAAVWVWFLRRPSRLPRLFTLALAVYGLFVAWVGLSVLWSIGPDLTWVAFDLAALYLAVAVLSGLTPVRRPQLRFVGAAYLAVGVAIAVYAFLGKALPETVTHAHQYARLSSPVGYWNVLALMLVMALPVALAFAADASAKPAERVAAAAAAVPLLFAFFFTFSRGGWIALLVVLAVYFALTSTRLSSFASLVAVAAPVGFVIWRLRDAPTLFQATLDAASRTAEGHELLVWSLVALGVVVVAQIAIIVIQRAWPVAPRTRAVIGAALAVVLLLGAVAGTWRFLETRGGTGWVRDRVEAFLGDADETSSANSAGRLLSLNTGRLPLWREALEQSQYVRASGTGAGTFPLTHYRFRERTDFVRHAHSQWLNVLSELGTVGLALFAAAMALLLAAAFGNPFARRGDPSRPLLVALQAGVVVVLVHISWDWDWDMAAVGVAFFLFAATCASYLSTRRADEDASGGAAVSRETGGAPSAGRSRLVAWPLRLALCLALVLLAASWALPYVAVRAENDALSASADGDTAAALDLARRASRYDPLAAGPLIMQAQLLQQLGRNREALDALQTAVRLQPDDFEVHRELGLLYLEAYARKRDAAAAFTEALALNPLDQELRQDLERAMAD